jgi:hypothetical protein
MAQEAAFGKLVFTFETKSLTKNATADHFFTLEEEYVESITGKTSFLVSNFVADHFYSKFRLASPDEYDFIEQKEDEYDSIIADAQLEKAKLENFRDEINETIQKLDKWLNSKSVIK